MAVTPSLTEFLGYDDPGQFIVQPAGNSRKGSPLPLPRFRLRSGTADTKVPDGYTLVISGLRAVDVERVKDKVPVLGSLPLLGRFFRTESDVVSTNALLVLITPTVMDQSGNRLTSK